MRGMDRSTVALAVVAMFAGYGCGGGAGEARQSARAPSNGSARVATLDTPGTTATTSAALTTNTNPTANTATTTTTAAAITRVSDARCERDETCREIGTGRAFGDRNECMNAVGHDFVTTLPDDACPSGVDSDRLAACISEMKSNPCREDDPKSAAGLPSSCAREQLCPAPR